MPLKLKHDIKAPTFVLRGEQRIALRDQRQDIGFRGLDELGLLNAHPAVGKFQTMFNDAYDLSQAYEPSLRITGEKLVVDDKYGRKTHLAFEKWTSFVNRIGGCGATPSDVRAFGPYAAYSCLQAFGWMQSEGYELQRAWQEWVDLAASNRAAGGGGSSGGGSGDAGGGGGGGGDPEESDSDLPPVPPVKDAGYLGPILFAVDISVGSFLSWWSKKWKRG